MDHLPIIMIVYEYTMARKGYMEPTDCSEWVITYLYENTIRSSPKESVPDLRNLLSFGTLELFCDYLPILCSLGCLLMFLVMNPGLWWYQTRLAPVRGVFPSATG